MAVEGFSGVKWPGERQKATRERNREVGIPVDDGVWAEEQHLAS
ncbi:hypothetical protein ACCY16_00855 [Candidatus Pantoea formicae]